MTQLAGTVGPGIVSFSNAAGDILWRNDGAVAEIVDPQTQAYLYPGEVVVQPDGSGTRTSSAGNRTGEITATADLATLVADGTDGDGNFGGGAFTAGQYVVLDDNAVAYYDGANWQSGVAA
jgi:hypothetical protein